MDPQAIAACIEANPGLIRGFKLRLVGPVAQEQGEELVRRCKAIAREHHLPLMVHIGDRPADYHRASEVTRFLLKSFEPGDILTHLATPHAGGVMLDEARTRLVPELQEARDSGVVLDPALGAGNLGTKSLSARQTWVCTPTRSAVISPLAVVCASSTASWSVWPDSWPWATRSQT